MPTITIIVLLSCLLGAFVLTAIAILVFKLTSASRRTDSSFISTIERDGDVRKLTVRRGRVVTASSPHLTSTNRHSQWPTSIYTTILSPQRTISSGLLEKIEVTDHGSHSPSPDRTRITHAPKTSNHIHGQTKQNCSKKSKNSRPSEVSDRLGGSGKELSNFTTPGQAISDALSKAYEFLPNSPNSTKHSTVNSKPHTGHTQRSSAMHYSQTLHENSASRKGYAVATISPLPGTKLGVSTWISSTSSGNFSLGQSQQSTRKLNEDHEWIHPGRKEKTDLCVPTAASVSAVPSSTYSPRLKSHLRTKNRTSSTPFETTRSQTFQNSTRVAKGTTQIGVTPQAKPTKRALLEYEGDIFDSLPFMTTFGAPGAFAALDSIAVTRIRAPPRKNDTGVTQASRIRPIIPDNNRDQDHWLHRPYQHKLPQIKTEGLRDDQSTFLDSATTCDKSSFGISSQGDRRSVASAMTFASSDLSSSYSVANPRPISIFSTLNETPKLEYYGRTRPAASSPRLKKSLPLLPPISISGKSLIPTSYNVSPLSSIHL